MDTTHPLLWVTLGLGLTSLACGLGGEPEPEPGPSDNPFDAVAPAVLPYDVDPGVERMRALYWMQALDDPQAVEDSPGLLIGVAAATDRLAVAFPPGQRAGYDVAWAEPGRPDWQRLELNDLDVDDVGAVSAARAPDDTVWFAFRKRTAPHTIRLWRWSLGADPVEVPFARVSDDADFPAYLDSCADLDVAVDPDGNVDLAYRQTTQTLYHARLAPGATEWTHTRVDDPDQYAYPFDGPHPFDLGCHVRLEHDESGQPNVVSLYRQLPADRLGAPIPRADLVGATRGWFRTPDGRWLAEGRRLSDGTGRQRREFGRTRGLELAAVEGSHTVSGPFVSEADVLGNRFDALHLVARPLRLVRDAQRLGGLDPRDVTPTDDPLSCNGSFEVAGRPWYAPAIARGGGAVLVSEHPSRWRVASSGCDQPHGARAPLALAPARQVNAQSNPSPDSPPDAPQMLGVRSPVAAHGARAYDVAVCVDEVGKLVVCWGGVVDLPEARARYSPGWGDDPGRAVFSITNGWGELRELTPGEYTFALALTQEVGPEASPDIQVRRMDVSQGDRDHIVGAFVEPPAGGSDLWEVTFDVEVGATYAITVGGIFSSREDFLRREGRGEVFVYGAPEWVDPRAEIEQTACFVDGSERDARGVCVEPLTLLGGAGPIRLTRTVDIDRAPGPPRLYDASGALVPSAVTTERVFDIPQWTELVPDATLPGPRVYEVRYPEGTVNMFGVPLPDSERIFYVSAPQSPLEFVESDPAHMATGVPTDVVITLTFNGPIGGPSPLTDAFRLEEAGVMPARAVPFQLRELPGDVWEVLPEALSPGTTYDLVLTDRLRTREGPSTTLVGAPITITFTTAAP